MKIKLITTILFLAALITACSSTPPPASTPSATATPQTAVTVSSTPTVEMTPTPFQAEATSTPPAVATTQPIDQPITLTAPQLNPLALGERISLTNTGDVTFQLRILNAYIGQSAARLILRARPAEELKLVVIIPEIKYVSGPAGQRQALINEDSFRIISKGHVLENDFMGYTPPSNHINEIRLLPGETSQAYLVFAVYKDDDHPVLRVTNQGKSYFFDLTKPVPPAAPVQITPLQFSAAGPGSAAQPVALGKSVLYHWQGATLLLTVDRMERGLDATKRIWNIGSINQAAGAGQEYIMPYLHVQVVSSTTDLTVIDRALFKIFSSGAPLENVSPLSCPMSCLSTLALYQGGEAQGWLPLAVSISDPQPVLGFNEELFFSLKESSPAQNAGSAEYIPPTFPANAITAATMKQVGTTAELQQHSTVYSLAFSPDNRLLASGSDDHKIHIWDTASGVELKTLEKHPMGVKYISFSADGKWMVSVSFDENIIVWNTADWQIVQQLKQGGQGIFGEFLPDNTLITANQAGTITQWDVSGGKALKKYQTQKNITAACSNSGLYSFDMTPDGKVFAAALACGYGVGAG